MNIKRTLEITQNALIEAGFKKMNLEDKSLPPGIDRIYWYELDLGKDDMLIISNAVKESEPDPKFFVEIFECGGLGRCFDENEMWKLLSILTKNKDVFNIY